MTTSATHPADRLFDLAEQTPEAFTLDHARALCKTRHHGAHLVDLLEDLQVFLEPAEFFRLIGEQLSRTGRTNASSSGVQSLLLTADEHDLRHMMCAEEQRFHDALDAEFDVYISTGPFGLEAWWYLSESEALGEHPGQSRAVKARVERTQCAVQFYPSGARIVPAALKVPAEA